MKKMMKIMLGLLLSTVLVVTMLGCPNGSTDDDKSGGDTDNIQGWWKYTTSVATVKSSIYIEYDSSGKVLRAGSNLEYKGVQFDKQVEFLEYNSLKKLVGTHISLKKIDKESLPSWANTDGTNSSTDYTWETAPDEGKWITTQDLSSTTWHGSDLKNTIRFYVYDDKTFGSNAQGTSGSSSGLTSIAGNVMESVSEIKIGTDNKGLYILTLKNGSKIIDSWTDPISFKLVEGFYSNSNQNRNEPIDMNYTWETAPDDEWLSKENLSATWKRDSDSNQIHTSNGTLVLNNQAFYISSMWKVYSTHLEVYTNQQGIVKKSEIKIGKAIDGKRILTIRDGKTLYDSWENPISFYEEK